MNKKQSMNFGFRGWILIIHLFCAFLAFVVFTNWPMNILADMYGGAATISTIYTGCIVGGIVLQLILSVFIGKLKSIKTLAAILGILSIVIGLCLMLIPPTMGGAWRVCYGLECLCTNMWATFSLGILVGQWFPRRKGTIMGLATCAFPIGNGLIGLFAGLVFKNGQPDVFGAFLPFWIICLIGLILGLIFIKDYPEQCGAYRDNDKSMTPEIAKAMMEAEIEAKKTSVWRLNHSLTNRDFWFVTIPLGALLMCSVGMMTQTQSILGMFEADIAKFGGFSGVMALIMVFGLVGSILLGLLDTKFGTKKAVLISVVLMVISGLLGTIPNATCLVASLIFLALFMGASSNFIVSVTAQYWRREDFSSVYASMNPIANILQAVGPMVIAILLGMKGYQATFVLILVLGIISLVLILLFSPKHIKKVDDKYRTKAGKALDDALVGRK